MSTNDMEQRLEASLAFNRAKLKSEAHTGRRVAVSHLLDEVSTTLLSDDTLPLNVLRKVFVVLFESSEMGLIRERLLRLLTMVKREDSIDLVLQALPAAMMTLPFEEQQEASAVLLRLENLLKTLAKQYPSQILRMAECLARISSEQRAELVSSFVLASLSIVSGDDLPPLVCILLKNVQSPEEAKLTWEVLCKKWTVLRRKVSRESTTTSLLFACSILSPWSNVGYFNQDVLLSTFITLFKRVAQDRYQSMTETLCFYLLVALSLAGDNDEFDREIGRLLDGWIEGGAFPFAALDSIVDLVYSDHIVEQVEMVVQSLRDRLGSGLQHLSLFLLLAPARLSLNLDMKATKDFVLNVHDRFEKERRAHLVLALLHLCEESAAAARLLAKDVQGQGTPKNRKRQLNEASKPLQSHLAHPLVFSILETIAEANPSSLARFKHVIVDRLSAATSCPDETSITGCCRILAILEPDGSSCDGVKLLQKLFFSGSSMGRSSCDNSRIRHGMHLASELVSRSKLHESDVSRVKGWILAVMLPKTRRTVEPELGVPGLCFLKTWMEMKHDKNESKDVFQHLKMVLSNTGLVQLLQSMKTGNSFLVFDHLPKEFARDSSQESKNRDMVFCLGSYLRRSDYKSHGKLGTTILWVFDLVDTYLRLGRQHAAKGWTPHGWLRAAVEFLPMDVPSGLSPEAESILLELCNFDVWESLLGVFGAPSSNDERDAVQALQPSFLCHTTNLSVAVSLLTAILRQCYLHYSQSSEFSSDDELLKLLQFQVVKIYVLRQKLSLLHAVASPTDGRPELSDALTTTDIALPIDCLWRCFCREDDFQALLSVFEGIRGSTTYSDSVQTEVLRPVHVKSALAYELNNHLERMRYGDGRSSGSKGCFVESFTHCLRLFLLVAEVLPVVRLAACQMDEGPGQALMLSMLSFALSQARLLSTMISIQREAPEGDLWIVCAEATKGVPELDSRNRTMEGLFDCFADLLGKVECVCVADAVVEILSVLSIDKEEAVELRFLAASSTAFRTIYTLEATRQAPKEPFVVQRTLNWPQDVRSCAVRALDKIVRSTVGAMTTKSTPIRAATMFDSYRPLLLRHWSWITQRNITFVRYGSQFLSLIGDLESFVSTLSEKTQKWASEDEKSDKAEEPKGSLPSRSSASLPFLSVRSCGDVYVFLLNMVVGAHASYSPYCESMSLMKATDPFMHLDLTLQAFRRLVDIYESHMIVFPRKIASEIIRCCRFFLQATLLQFERCAEWRCEQPLLAVAKRQAGTVDPGSISFLSRLYDTMVTNACERIAQLCSAWTAAGEGFPVLSRCKSLRQATDKVLASIRSVAALHNLPLLCGGDEEGDLTRCTTIEEPGALGSIDNAQEEDASSEARKASTFLASCEGNSSDSDGSFGAEGEWGASEGEEDDLRVEDG